jgi:transcriptional antiterminator RfaH
MITDGWTILMSVDPMGTSQSKEWLIAQTKPRAEALAMEHLQRQGFVPYLPRINRTVRHAGKFKTRLEPLFPGYIFIGLTRRSAGWRSVNGTRGVVRILASGDGPHRVDMGFMLELFGITDAEGVLERSVSDFHEGQEVEVSVGPFAGMIAEITNVGPKQRINILLQVLGRSIETTIDSSDLTST